MHKAIKSEWQESGTYVIELKTGYHNGSDPLQPEHLIMEDSRREAHARLSRVRVCKCRYCVTGIP
jgi:hypothetical protein